jgi:putative cell wall-binding protein
MGIQINRISGADRFRTSLEIARNYSANYNYKKIVIATGETFADALTAAAFAKKGIYPVILTGSDSIPQDVLDYIGKSNIDNVYIIGGPGAVSDEVKDRIR